MIDYIISCFRSFFTPTYDLAEIPFQFHSWFYLNGRPEVINVGIDEYEIYVTMRGNRGLYAKDPDYWSRIRIKKLGKKKFNISETEKIFDYIMEENDIAHSDHG